MAGIQLVGIAVGLGAVHLTYLYYKRAHFTKKELYFWLFLWLSFIFIAVFPRSVTPLVGFLQLSRVMDLIMIIAFIVLFILTFHNYIVNRQNKNKLEKLTRRIALENSDARGERS